MNDDELRRRLHASLDAESADRGFADRVIAAAVSVGRGRGVPRRLASVAVGLAVAAILTGALVPALWLRGGHPRPPAATHRVIGVPSPEPTVEPTMQPTVEPSASPSTSPAPVVTTSTPAPTPVPSPGARSHPAMAYDPSNNTVLLYGGYRSSSNATTYLRDTWRWDGHRWTPLGASAGTLYSVAMAYDKSSDQMILVGATTERPDGTGANTYVWSGGNWRQLQPAISPVNFDTASLAYDQQSRRLMLLAVGYGSASYSSEIRLYAWDGTQWAQLWQSPAGTNVTYGPHVLIELPGSTGFAGLGLDTHDNDGTPQGAVYTFSGSTWMEDDVPGTPGEVAAATYDIGHQHAVVVGGNYRPLPDASPGVDSTYTFDGATWTSTPLPHALLDRIDEGMAFDKAGAEVLLVGGVIGQGNISAPPPPPPTDTWGWNGSSWSVRAQ